MTERKKSDANDKTYRAGSANMFESLFMFVDAELKHC